jgi:methanogenic corrinoid protein MtbC1
MQRLRVRFLLAIMAGDVRVACDVMDAAREEGADADEVVITIVRPALQEVGLRWAAGELASPRSTSPAPPPRSP